MSFINPTGEQIRELAALPEDGPVVMVNLLKFKPETGEESYATYSRAAYKIVRNLGGRVVYSGRGSMPFIGNEKWDFVLLVEYPSARSFLEMISSPEYLEASRYRTEALEDSRLYVTVAA